MWRDRAAAGGGGVLSAGFVEIDADENVATGHGSSTDLFGGSAELGVDHEIDLFDADSASVVLASGTGAATRVPASYRGSSLVVRIPSQLIGTGSFGFAGVVGTVDRATDVFPNSGHHAVQRVTAASTVRVTADRSASASPSRIRPRLAERWGVGHRATDR